MFTSSFLGSHSNFTLIGPFLIFDRWIYSLSITDPFMDLPDRTADRAEEDLVKIYQPATCRHVQ